VSTQGGFVYIYSPRVEFLVTSAVIGSLEVSVIGFRCPSIRS
jgi:hypothetical protein